MNQMAVFIFGVIVGGVVVWFLAGRGVKKERDSKLIEEKRKQKEETRKKILAMLENKAKISNNEVERALGLSDATAERHLDELEKDGVLKQVGKVGRDVYYEKI